VIYSKGGSFSLGSRVERKGGGKARGGSSSRRGNALVTTSTTTTRLYVVLLLPEVSACYVAPAGAHRWMTMTRNWLSVSIH